MCEKDFILDIISDNKFAYKRFNIIFLILEGFVWHLIMKNQVMALWKSILFLQLYLREF